MSLEREVPKPLPIGPKSRMAKPSIPEGIPQKREEPDIDNPMPERKPLFAPEPAKPATPDTPSREPVPLRR